MTRRIHLSARILMPMVYVFIFNTLFSPLPALPERQKFSVGQFIQNWIGISEARADDQLKDCAPAIKDFAQKVETAREAIASYNEGKTVANPSLDAIDRKISTIPDSPAVGTQAQAILSVIKAKYTNLQTEVRSKKNSSAFSEIQVIHATPTALKDEISPACEAEKQLTEEKVF